MIDVINDPIGTKYGCKYSYTGTNAVGTFSNLNSTVTDGRCVKDPTTILGYNFEAKNIPDKVMFSLRSGITINTTKTYKTDVSVLGSGTEEVTKELVDFSKYKEVIAFSTIGEVVLTAIPKDQLFVMKEPISTAEYVSGIYSITANVTNAFVKVAVGDGTNYYTFDATGTTWSQVDLTHDTDTLKTEMMDYTVLNAITQAQYALQFPTLNKLSFAVLIGIDPVVTTTDGVETSSYDTSKTYSLNSIIVNYVGDDTTGPSYQYFNFVKAGYTYKGNPILVADRTIQQNISFTTLYAKNYVFGNTTVDVTDSEIPYNLYVRLPKSSTNGTDDEWTKTVVEGYLPTGKTTEEYYNTEIPSLTATIATEADTKGASSGTNANLVCRGGDSPEDYFNIATATTSADCGWRPVFEVDLATIRGEKPSTVLDEVYSIKDLAVGKAISCDYEYTAGKIGTFKNLGNASLGLLTDYKNTTSGSFYFNCVGFDKDGNPICVADRPVATGMNYSTLVSGNTPDITGYKGKQITIDDSIYNMRLLFPNAGKELDENNEYSKFMTTLGTTHTFKEIWHMDKTLTWTNTIYNSDTKSNMMIVKGLTDDTRTSKAQRYLPYNTTSAAELEISAFRPVMVFIPQVHIDSFEIIPYVGHEAHDKQKLYNFHVIILDDKNNAMKYKLAVGSKIIKDYSNDEDFTISVDEFDVGSNNIDVIVKITDPKTSKEEEKTLETIEVYKDSKRRTTTFRKFGKRYGGWNTDGSVDYHQTSPSAATSYKQKVTNYVDVGVIDISKFATKITFN